MFGRATIRLGIGPHSSFIVNFSTAPTFINCNLIAKICFVMVALWNRADHYIFMLWFVLLSSSHFLYGNSSTFQPDPEYSMATLATLM